MLSNLRKDLGVAGNETRILTYFLLSLQSLQEERERENEEGNEEIVSLI